MKWTMITKKIHIKLCNESIVYLKKYWGDDGDGEESETNDSSVNGEWERNW